MSDVQARPVTISDIAAQAGVSTPTVSRVLNRRSDVAPHTRERVEHLLREHGYRRRGEQVDDRAWLIDLVFNDLDSPWAVEVIRGVEEAAHTGGAGVVVSAIHRRRSSAREWLQNLRARASDGVILVTTALDPDLHEELRRLHVPAVAIDPAGLPDLDIPTIGATNWAGALAATEHLTGLGHQRIGLVEGRPGLSCSRARLGGYRAGIESAGLAFDPDLVTPGSFDYASGFEGGTRLLQLDRPPTAVFAASDEMALGVYEAVRQRGLRVPEDLSIVGFDDLPQARWASPPLTTVRQPLEEMGRFVVHTVLRLMNDGRLESAKVELATDLVVRESTRAPRS
ncbi:LacI family DNA-binding transcriptional regulator [Microlunatus lacustris]